RQVAARAERLPVRARDQSSDAGKAPTTLTHTSSASTMEAVNTTKSYGDVAAEHEAATKRAGVIDRSTIGKIVVTGRDRQAFLQGMLTNDIKGLQPGQGIGAAFLDAHGKVMALLDVYVLEDRLLLELPPGLTERTLERLDKFLISEKAYFEASDDSFA